MSVMMVSQECAERGCAAHDDRVDGPGVMVGREWVGLTDEAIWRQYQALWPFHPAEEPRLAKDIARFARAIEAAHGRKE